MSLRSSAEPRSSNFSGKARATEFNKASLICGASLSADGVSDSSSLTASSAAQPAMTCDAASAMGTTTASNGGCLAVAIASDSRLSASSSLREPLAATASARLESRGGDASAWTRASSIGTSSCSRRSPQRCCTMSATSSGHRPNFESVKRAELLSFCVFSAARSGLRVSSCSEALGRPITSRSCDSDKAISGLLARSAKARSARARTAAERFGVTL
mmetsp:Transcript_24282/g.53993  ORF Transcript_24282/g.53993 Transcript_24282/m.53993 type:complete len:217 (+) Transcript_24282:652-1302(+)